MKIKHQHQWHKLTNKRGQVYLSCSCGAFVRPLLRTTACEYLSPRPGVAVLLSGVAKLNARTLLGAEGE